MKNINCIFEIEKLLLVRGCMEAAVGKRLFCIKIFFAEKNERRRKGQREEKRRGEGKEAVAGDAWAVATQHFSALSWPKKYYADLKF